MSVKSTRQPAVKGEPNISPDPHISSRAELLRGSLTVVEYELHKIHSLLNFIDRHGDEDASAMADLMRPYFEKLDEQAEDMRLVLYAPGGSDDYA